MRKFIYLIILLLAFTGFLIAQEQTIDLTKPEPTLEKIEANEFDNLALLAKTVTVTGKVISVHDGDTIQVLDSSKQIYKCRFNGIDAPELKMDFGNKSKQSLSDMAFGKTATIEYNKVDKYGRFVCKVFVNGVDVNLEQIKRGMAWHYKKYQDEQTTEDRQLYANAEINARNQKIGLWAGNPTAPWDWRRGENNPNLEGVPTGSIIGNTNSMIYHVPGCSSYAKVATQNRIIFKDEKEAISKGYRISGQCTSSLPVEERPKKVVEVRKYQTGSRGGCFYLNSSGNKVYVDKSFCQK